MQLADGVALKTSMTNLCIAQYISRNGLGYMYAPTSSRLHITARIPY